MKRSAVVEWGNRRVRFPSTPARLKRRGPCQAWTRAFCFVPSYCKSVMDVSRALTNNDYNCDLCIDRVYGGSLNVMIANLLEEKELSSEELDELKAILEKQRELKGGHNR